MVVNADESLYYASKENKKHLSQQNTSGGRAGIIEQTRPTGLCCVTNVPSSSVRKGRPDRQRVRCFFLILVRTDQR